MQYTIPARAAKAENAHDAAPIASARGRGAAPGDGETKRRGCKGRGLRLAGGKEQSAPGRRRTHGGEGYRLFLVLLRQQLVVAAARGIMGVQQVVRLMAQ